MIINHPQEIIASKELIFEMKKYVKHVSFDQMTRLLYSTDASIYQMVPVGVVFPRNSDEICAVISIAAKFGVPVLARGSGSSLAGQAVGHAIIIDFSRYMDKVIDIDPQKQEAVVEPGITLSRFNTQLKPYGLKYGPDPASEDRATIGGIIGNNSTGAHSIIYGMTHEHVKSLEVVLADSSLVNFGPLNTEVGLLKYKSGVEGEIFNTLPKIIEKYSDEISKKYPKTFRHVSGYNLNLLLNPKNFNLSSLIVGSEGTLGVVTKAKLNLVKIPKNKCLALVHFNDLAESLDAVPGLLETEPSAVELLDDMLIGLVKEKSGYNNLLDFIVGEPKVIHIVEYSGDNEKEISVKLKRLENKLKSFNHKGSVLIISDETEQAKIWHVRKVGLGILMSVKGDAKPLPVIEDAAVPVEHLKRYILQIKEHAKSIGIEKVAMYAHASAGCLHVRPLINLKTENGLEQLRSIAEKSVELVRQFGGSNSGEHGDGIVRGEFLENLFGSKIIEAFQEVKDVFDPNNLMNPGKIVNTPKMDDVSLLRYGPNYNLIHIPEKTVFNFNEFGSFEEAIEMCNGAGVCRKHDYGVMCPSFQVLRDEAHSTRGRANALRSVMTGQFGDDGFYSKELHEIMNYCLGCQACKSECPSNVDMAKIKSEYLYQYQIEKGIPLSSRIFANISSLYKFAQKFSGISNALMRGPGKLFLRLIGIHPNRKFPQIAKETFSQWFKKNRPSSRTKKVVFFHDTFVEYNNPEIGRAAIIILEKAGFEPILVEKLKCCGRSALSKGLLDEAKAMAIHNIDMLAPFSEQGIPIVGVEPSCITMISDDYIDLVPGDKTLLVSNNIQSFEEFIVQENQNQKLNFIFSREEKNILFHGHCQQKANYGTSNTIKFLEMIPNATIEEIDSGCCGMAGTFGYEKKNYDLSIAIASQRLKPVIENAHSQTVICATGTSCREQIAHTTDRNALHPIIIFANSLLD